MEAKSAYTRIKVIKGKVEREKQYSIFCWAGKSKKEGVVTLGITTPEVYDEKRATIFITSTAGGFLELPVKKFRRAYKALDEWIKERTK